MSEVDEVEFSKIPKNFPRPEYPSALPGTQPKLIMTKYKEKYYVVGCTPPEIYERWRLCVDYVTQLNEVIHASRTERSTMSEEKIIGNYLDAFFEGGLVSKDEAHWVRDEVLRCVK